MHHPFDEEIGLTRTPCRDQTGASRRTPVGLSVPSRGPSTRPCSLAPTPTQPRKSRPGRGNNHSTPRHKPHRHTHTLKRTRSQSQDAEVAHLRIYASLLPLPCPAEYCMALSAHLRTAPGIGPCINCTLLNRCLTGDTARRNRRGAIIGTWHEVSEG
ncbi:hypothetical protein BCV69DRAFT_152393 [Microstroma glucosiphilum]|uniref:Uncharacterized protein n=1 Tax=Pseudomicrostroma glucosiphilum TaxID=1684307 RepID=A0A316U907_9BASI|nr:hypothetical protein BCV69DRAFT_152393 [Pseudomicrostroma glucosiphilum]PWN21696.1 hypothetical protein BCV69DRAFT_152393 [Pseudomicrostroma glucosiphilum]